VRVSPFVIATVLVLNVGCGHRADSLKVNAPIPAEDVQEICAVVRVETSEPISEISAVETEAHVPGITPRQYFVPGKDGTPETMHPCPDRVWVFTHPAQGAPLWFDLHKKDSKWTIVKTERVTYRKEPSPIDAANSESVRSR